MHLDRGKDEHLLRNYGPIPWNDYTLSEGSIVNYFESGHLSTMDFDGSKQPVATQNQGEE